MHLVKEVLRLTAAGLSQRWTSVAQTVLNTPGRNLRRKGYSV